MQQMSLDLPFLPAVLPHFGSRTSPGDWRQGYFVAWHCPSGGRLPEVGSSLVPIHNVPPNVDVVGALGLMLQIVGVFPHVDADDTLGPLHVRAVLVGRAEDCKLLVLANAKPCPAGAEAAETRRLDGSLHLLKVTEGSIDGAVEIARGLAGAAGRHQLPEERMVPMAAQVVADGNADRFGGSSQIGQGLIDWLGGEIWPLLYEPVEVVDVGRVVVVVMDLHGLGIDVRLERIICIAEWRQREGLLLRQR